MLTAVLINAAATACSLILPYFLGRFMGMDMVNSLKGRFKAIKKLDDFAGENSFTFLYALPALLFAIGASVFMSRRQKKKQQTAENK